MAGRKRAAEDSPEATARTSPKRAAKAAKVASDGETASPTKTKAAGTRKPASTSAATKKVASSAAPKATVPTSAHFMEHALPLHIHVTHTPPTAEVPGSATDPTPKLSTDPGFIASIVLAPSEFSTGSFGWKGSKRVNVELVNTAAGTKEVVPVMMSFNATVVGSKSPEASKSAKQTKGKAKKKKQEEEDENEDEDD